MSGPQLVMDKDYLFMESNVSKTQNDSVTVSNVGSSAVFYEWRKFARGDFIKAKRSDGLTRFYSHYSRGVLQPGESKSFTFMFISDKPGIFTEEWDLLTDPELSHPISQLQLTGYAKDIDPNVAYRHNLEKRMAHNEVLHNVQEILTDVVRDVRTPEPLPPNLDDPEECREQFESKNLKHQIWYTSDVINMLYKLEERLESQEKWDLTLDHMREMVNAKQDDALSERLDWIIQLAKAKPLTRSPYIPYARNKLLDLASQIPDISARIRPEFDLEEYNFVQTWLLTEEEIEQLEKEKAEKEALRAKQQKGKKPKTEEDLEKDRQNYRDKFAAEMGTALIDLMCQVVDESEFRENWRHMELLHQARTLPYILDNTNRLNKGQKNSNIANNVIAQQSVSFLDDDTIGDITRKYGMGEVDMEGRRVLVRLNLDIELVKEEPIEESNESQESIPKVTKGKKPPPKKPPPKKPPPKKSPAKKVVKKVEEAPVEDTQENTSDPAVYLIKDMTKVNKALTTVRYCLDHLAKSVIIMGNLGPRTGRPQEQYSMKPIAEFMKKEIEQQLYFREDIAIENFEEAIEDLPENSAIFIENTAFHPAEFGYKVAEDGAVTHVPLNEIMKFRELVFEYSEVFVNDVIGQNTCMETNPSAFCSLTNPGCSTLEAGGPVIVAGHNLEHELKGFTKVFYTTSKPFIVCFGNSSNLSDQVLMAYVLCDMVDIMVIGGALALQFLPHFTDFEVPNIDERLKPFIERFLAYAKIKGVEVILPKDFQVSEVVAVPEDQKETGFTWAHFSENSQVIKLLPKKEEEEEEEKAEGEEEEEVEQQEQIPEGYQISAFGPESTTTMMDTISKAKSIFWSGSMDFQLSDKVELMPYSKIIMEVVFKNKDESPINMGIHNCLPEINQSIAINGLLSGTVEEEKGNESVDVSMIKGATSSKDQLNSTPAEGEGEAATTSVHFAKAEHLIDEIVAHVFDSGPLVTNILQGRKIIALDSIHGAPRPKVKTAEDDTSYLDNI